MIQFLTAKNLRVPGLEVGEPWKFAATMEALEEMRKLPKAVRRKRLLDPATNWQVYSAVQGVLAQGRISKDNAPALAYGIAVDYDSVAKLEAVLENILAMPEGQRPNYIEVTLSKKIRLVWLFEKPILIPSPAFYEEMVSTFFAILQVPTLLAGYDSASLKYTEMWTNGGEWYQFSEKPLPWDFCFGVICGVSKKSSLFENGEIPMEVIAAEVAKRWPGRWQGDFVLDSLGVRFWDEKADNPTGCQVKPDGLLCFTGHDPFIKWAALFGLAWYEEQRVLNLGRAAEDIYFDGRVYWEGRSGRQEDTSRVDIMMRLAGRGLSTKTAKGANQSDVERVLDHIQQVNRVQGAAPLVNYPKGIVNYKGRRILNTADLNPVQPAPGPAGQPELDFPFIWGFLNGFFPRPELLPLEHFQAWLQRAYRMVLEHQRFMGQATFICGPRNNGKTLLCMRIVAPLMGGRTANPINYMAGDTTFNSELFSTALLAINDEDAPSSEGERRKMLAKLKGLVVNPFHTYNAKFEKATEIEWVGRLFVTLNDDPGSVNMLMEVEENTRDKQMFFASQPYRGTFPRQDLLEVQIAQELPCYAHYLLNWTPPAEVLSDDRMGVKSYFDPHILELSHQQTFASNLSELLSVWVRTDSYWADEAIKNWDGSPTDLLSCLQGCDTTAGIARDWSQARLVRALTSLAKRAGSGISFADSTGRHFKIKRL